MSQTMFLSRQRRVGGLLAALALTTVTACGSSDTAGGEDTATSGSTDYPTKSVTLNVPYAAGGGTDVVYRLVQPHLEEALGQSVVITNTPGGGGVVGTAAVANGAADGYQIGTPIDSILTLQPRLNPDVKFNYEAFKAIKTFETPQVLVAKADAPFEDLETFVEAAKQKSGMRYGNPGTASSNDLNGRALQLAADIELRSVPFAGGGADVLQALLRGDVEVAVMAYGAVKGMVDADKVKVLGILDNKGLDALPDAQTPEEAGLESPYFHPTAAFLVVPSDTPEDVVEVLAKATKETVEVNELSQALAKIGTRSAYLGVEESNSYLKDLDERLVELLKEFPDLTAK